MVFYFVIHFNMDDTTVNPGTGDSSVTGDDTPVVAPATEAEKTTEATPEVTPKEEGEPKQDEGSTGDDNV